MSFAKYFAVIMFSLLVSSYAFAIPGIPHQFYGFVTINGAAADNANIVAKINGTEYGSTVSINGNYGIEPGGIFFVTDPNSSNAGKDILFFVNGNAVNQAAIDFENGGYIMLNLSVGAEPFCGDSFCSAGETSLTCEADCGPAYSCGDGTCNATEDCSSCEADCGACGPFCGDGTCDAGEDCTSCPGDCGACGGTGPVGGGGGGSGGGGGGGGAELQVSIEGNCVGQDVVVTVLNSAPFSNPADNSTVKVRQNNMTVQEQVTGADGIVTFVLSEAGTYSFITTRDMYRANYKTIEFVECAPGEGSDDQGDDDQGEDQGNASGNLCANVNCDDDNPCTTEICASSTGHCSYTNQADGISCGIEGKCMKGVCEEPEEEDTSPGFGAVGFFGLNSAQGTGLGIVVVALIALAAYLLTASKKKKKKKK